MISATGRLNLREATTADAEFFLTLLNEPAWLKFISQHEMRTHEHVVEYLETKIIPSYSANGFGFWVVELKADQQPIGICGFIKRDSLEHADLGFAFLEAVWGQGYAFEAAVASLKYAKINLSEPKILAITLPENKRSSSLLERLGFDLESTFSHSGSDEILSLYSLTLLDS
ncbi:MAG: GNAT family N-acetyltransferase [Anaerolineae bacterium]